MKQNLYGVTIKVKDHEFELEVLSDDENGAKNQGKACYPHGEVIFVKLKEADYA